MKKKLLATLLATAMVVSLAACGSTEAPAASDAPASNDAAAASDDAAADDASDDSAAADTATADIDTSEHVVITYLTIGDLPNNTANDDVLAQLNAILTEKVNAELDLYAIGWTDYMTNYRLTLTQMDGTVDLVSAADWMDEWTLSKDGAFLPLSEEMLATYCPITYSEVSQEHWDMCKYNGEIMFIPEDSYTQRTNHGFIYRKDWAKEAGLDGVHSWDDLTEYFKWVKANKDDVIPWDVNGGNSVWENKGGWLSSHVDELIYEIGVTNVGTCIKETEPNKVYNSYFEYRDVLVEYAKLMKEWDSIGVWRTDVLNNTSSDNRADYKIGKTSVDQHHTQTWTGLVSAGDLTNKIYQDDPDAESGFFWFGEEKQHLINESVVHGTMAISAASENPERALMVYDLLRNDPECYRLINYGIEGRQYAIDENGMKYQPDTYVKEDDDIMFDFWEGRTDKNELKDARLDWDAIDALYEEYNKISSDNPYLQFVFDSDPVQTQISNVTQVTDKYMKLLTYGKFDGEAEDFIDSFLAELKSAGVEDIDNEVQSQLNAFYGVNETAGAIE